LRVVGLIGSPVSFPTRIGSTADQADMTSKIEVCRGGRCGRHDIVKDIEELAKAAGCCKVKRSGCMGKCSSAPNVIVTLNGQKDVYRQVRKQGLDHLVQKASDMAKAFRESGLYKPSCQERFWMVISQKLGWTFKNA